MLSLLAHLWLAGLPVFGPQQEGAPSEGAIDLSGEEHTSLFAIESNPGTERSWFERVSVWGHVAGTFLDSGGAGRRPDGWFFLHDASVFLEAYPSDTTAIFLELMLERASESFDPDVGEAYLTFRDLLGPDAGDSFDLKVGRFDVPFGEEYLAFDSVDNDLVTNSAASIYGLDRGVLASGELGGVGWIAAVTNGSNDASLSQDPFRSYALKVHGRPAEDLYLSASAMTTGRVHASALKVSGFYLTPVGCYGPSTAGTSPSTEVESYLWELDALWDGSSNTQVEAHFGQLILDDDVSTFDRHLLWFELEPRVQLSDRSYVAARYSEIGTYDDDEGYRLDGFFVAGGDVFGYDTQRLQRFSVTYGWSPYPSANFKAEIGLDRYDLIDASPFDPDNDERLFVALEAVLSF